MQHIFDVSELTRSIKDVIESEFPFVWVRGQVGNVSRPGSGHLYFTLKDEEGALSVVWFKGAQAGLMLAGGERYDPLTGEVLERSVAAGLAEGMEVLCAGRLTVYPPRGAYQLVAELVQEVGAGRLWLAFEALKQELAGKGYFDSGRKRPLPRHPLRVAVVTAPSGAAVRDFLRVGRERGHGAAVRVYPTLVQGDAAPAGIVRAMSRAAADGWAEVVVLIRGGGSLEDLWAFNTREVAEAIFASRLPVVTGVGHEVDVTIADMVADVRSATPTHAAQLLWPEREQYIQRVDDLETVVRRAALAMLAIRERELAQLIRALAWLSPQRRLSRLTEAFEAAVLRLDWAGRRLVSDREGRLQRASTAVARFFGPESLALREEALSRRRERLTAAGKSFLDARERAFERAEAVLVARDPKAPLARGYSLVASTRTGKFLRRAADVEPGDKLEIMVYEGRVQATVTERFPPEGEGT